MVAVKLCCLLACSLVLSSTQCLHAHHGFLSKPCIAVKVSQPFHSSSCPCRFARLANGSGKVAIADMLQLPELSGNVLMEPILRLFDGDRDGYLTEAEVCRAVRKLGELQQEGADPCQGGTSICVSDPLHHCGLFCFYGPKAFQ